MRGCLIVRLAMAPYWEDAAHSLKGTQHIVDIRTIGLVAGIEMEPRPGAPGARGHEVFTKCYEADVSWFAQPATSSRRRRR